MRDAEHYIVLQLPVGDMTFDEGKSTMELFVTEVKPQLDTVTIAAWDVVVHLATA